MTGLLPGVWADDAACRGHWRYFYPADNERPNDALQREAVARRFCAACPVLIDCSRWVWNGGPDPAPDGFAAGASYAERQARRRALDTGQSSLLDPALTSSPG